VTVRPIKIASPAVSHADRLKALESYTPKRKAAGGAVAQREHVVSIGTDLKQAVMNHMHVAERETGTLSPEEAKQFGEITKLKDKIHTFLRDGQFTAGELANVLANVSAVQSALLDDLMRVCEAKLERSEAKLERSEAKFKQCSTKLAEESYIPFESPPEPPPEPPPKYERAMRTVVAMLTAGGMLMSAMQSAQAVQPGQAFDVDPSSSFLNF
jgi:hypothetical protein